MIGRTVGHYRIESKLGEGGMGVVYKAEDVHLARRVALKFLHSSTDAARLLAEAKAAGAISHPNICTIHEVDPEHAFIAMEYIDGRTLKARIDNRPLPADEALRIALAIGEGLRAAHAKGIIHRDIKSANVMVSDTGDVKVMDFGLARSSAQADVTREGYSSGTPGYMAPEQERGEPLDRRADIWAFGAVLHEMLTGRLPTGGIGMLPTSLDRIVRKALAPERDKRYQHIEDVLVDLRRVHAPKESTLRMTIAVSAAVSGVAIAAASWLWIVRPSTPRAEVALTAVPLTSYAGSERHPSFSPDGTQVVFSWARGTGAGPGIYIKQVGVEEPFQLADKPGQEFFPSWSPDGSQIAFIRALAGDRNAVVLIPQRGGPERVLTEFVDPPLSAQMALGSVISWTPDSRTLVVGGREVFQGPSTLYTVSLANGEKRRLTTPPPGHGGDINPAVSPDGRTLAFTRSAEEGRVDIYAMPLTADVRAAGDPVKLPGPGRINSRPAWTPDGSEIVFDAATDLAAFRLWRRGPTPSAAPRPLPVASQNASQAKISLTGNRMVYVASNSDTNIWRMNLAESAAGTRRPSRFIASTRDDSEPDFSPDGNSIAFTSARSGFPEIWLGDRDGSHLRQLTSLRGRATGQPRWSPDGRFIAFRSDVAGNRDIFLTTLSGEVKQLTNHPAADVGAEWSRDGRWIYFVSERASETGTSWKVAASGGEALRVEGFGNIIRESWDGKWFYHPGGNPDRRGIWRTPAGGGQTEVFVERIAPASGWRVFDDGIYFIGPASDPDAAPIQFKSFRSGAVETLGETRRRPASGLAVSPDRKTILFAQFDESGSDLMLVENFK